MAICVLHQVLSLERNQEGIDGGKCNARGQIINLYKIVIWESERISVVGCRNR
jgi:hypothetical protein